MKAKPTDASLHLFPSIYHSCYNWISLYALRDLNCQVLVKAKTEVTCSTGGVPWKCCVFLFAVKVLDSGQFYRHMFYGVRLNQNKTLQIWDLKPLADRPHAGRYCYRSTMPDVIVQSAAHFNINTAIKTTFLWNNCHKKQKKLMLS